MDSAVWVGVGRGGIRAKVCRACPERALSELRVLAWKVVGGATSTRVLLVKVVVAIVGPAISPYQRDGDHDSSKSADGANDAESNTDSSFVRKKATGVGAGSGRGINGRCGVAGGEKETAGHR